MTNLHSILRRHAKEYGIRLDIVEKDYALSYLLSAIAETPGLGDQIALKGGTALKKVYFAEYRFSEDLDYSTLRLGALSNLPDAMERAVERATDRLQERGPFDVFYELLRLKQPHPSGQAAFLVRVRFPGQRQALCRLKVEITVDEEILLPVEEHPLRHGFQETLNASVKVYALPEIVAEKLRALLQSRQRLLQRGWGASRVCRDYHDLWAVLSSEAEMGNSFPDVVRKKCASRNISFSSPEEFLSADLQEIARQEWEQQLSPFVPNAPSVDRVLDDLHTLIPRLFQ